MVMHGFDIWLDQKNAEGMYEGLLRDARVMVESMGVAVSRSPATFMSCLPSGATA